MAVSESIKTDSLLSNPAPLGLMGFGVTTVLLNISNAGYFPVDSVIIAMGIFYGGIAQMIAGAMEFRKGNTFGTTAFLSYGLFWLSFAFMLMLPALGLGAAPSSTSVSAYLFMWGLFTLLMFVGTLKLNGALMLVFSSLALLFFLLSAGEYWGNSTVTHIAGYEGIICGLSAVYASIANVLNEVYRRQVLPLFPVGQRA